MNSQSTRLAFVIAAVAGMMLWFAASYKLGKREPWDDPLYWNVVYPAAVLASGIMGGLFPQRPWRWVLTLFLAQFVAMMIRNGEVGSLWPLGLLLFCVMAIPGIALAKVTAWAHNKLSR